MRRTMAETHGMRYGNLTILTFVMGCMFFFLSPAAAQEDVGMVTRLSGEAVYWGAADHGKSSSAQAFMKVRDGDFFKLQAGCTLQFIIFEQGQKETWQGPVSFQLTSFGGQIKSNGDTPQKGPIVSKVPLAITKEVKRVAAMVDVSKLYKVGAFQVRGNKSDVPEQPLESVVLSSEELKDLEQARNTYSTMTKHLDPHDITSELYLFSVMADFDQYPEMDKLIALMRKKQPENKNIDELEIWLKEQY